MKAFRSSHYSEDLLGKLWSLHCRYQDDLKRRILRAVWAIEPECLEHFI